ncbi:protein FAM114A2 isoform X2 [Palaemon carinicauda]|uniref:protein FAM114A2 isoform X2 n=1 Tax=Palaemon carinicauda TaxID=392227 RepID=UPI0035B5B2E4
MSSESDDDFQSADEGSDLEDFESPNPQKPILPEPVKPEIADSSDSEEENDEEEEEIQPVAKSVIEKSKSEAIEKECGTVEDTSLIGVLKNLSLQVNEQLSLAKSSLDSVDNHSEDEESKRSDDEESKRSDDEESDRSDDEGPLECTFKTFPGALTSDSKLIDMHVENVENSVKTQLDNVQRNTEELSALDTCKEVTQMPEITKEFKEIRNEKVALTKEPESEPPQMLKESIHVEEKADEEKSSVSVNESRELVGCDTQEAVPLEKIYEEKKSETLQQATQKPKPIRESKIGLKKPREKLGERLGARKLGSRVEKKPMEGLGCESIKQVDPSSDEKPCTHLGSEEAQTSNKNEKKLEDSLWEQEDRWQQAQKTSENRKSDERNENGSDWGASWGNWGTTLITAASTLTQEVGRGVGTIMDTVEGSLGVPDPETLAREISEREKEYKLHKKTQEHTKDEDEQEPVNETKESQDKKEKEASDGETKKDFGLGGFSSLGSIVSGVSGVFETASNKVLMGGLDTLEVIGRKAMDVIQDGDPGLRKKRAFLANAKPNLSAILQEARHRAAEEEKNQREGTGGNDGRLSHKATFDQAWESTEGCVHIEALSLVARQCESKMSSMLQNMPHYLSEKIQSANAEIRNACELEEECTLEDDFISRVEDIMPLTGLPLQPQKICSAWKSLEETVSLIKEAGVVDGPKAEQELFMALAALVSQLAAVIHKGAELALITPGTDPVNVALQFKELSCVMCGGIENIADNVCGIITSGTSAADPQINNTITNIYLQSANGNSYIRQCMTHLTSVLQYSKTKHMAADL